MSMEENKGKSLIETENDRVVLDRRGDGQLTPEAREILVDKIEDDLRKADSINEVDLSAKYGLTRKAIRRYVLEAAERVRHYSIKDYPLLKAIAADVISRYAHDVKNKKTIEFEDTRHIMELLEGFQGIEKSENQRVENIDDARRVVEYNQKTTIFATPRTAREYIRILEEAAKEEPEEAVNVEIKTHEDNTN